MNESLLMLARLRLVAAVCCLPVVLAVFSSAPASAASLGKPTGLKVATGTDSATITWTAAKGADRYKVCLNRPKSSRTCETSSGAVRQLSHTFTGLTARSGTDYEVTLYAYRGSARTQAPKKAVELSSLGTVTQVSVDTGTTAATLMWKSAAGADRYKVCLNTPGSGRTCEISSGAVRALEYTFTGLARRDGTDYHATVYAYMGSDRTVSDKISVELGGVDAPSGVKVSTTPSTATVSWQPSAGADRYKACLNRPDNGLSCEVSSGAVRGLEYTFTGLTARDGTDYYVTLYAYNGSASAKGSRVAVDLETAAASEGLTVKTTETSAAFTWEEAQGADRYKLCLNRPNNGRSCEVSSGAVRALTYTFKNLSPIAGIDYYATLYSYEGSSATKGERVPVRLDTEAEVKVMTYNLCRNNQCVDGASPSVFPQWDVRKPLIDALVSQGSPDIITTQEINSGVSFPGYDLVEYKGNKAIYARAGVFTVNAHGTGVLPKADLPTSAARHVPWADLTHRDTGERFMIAGPHLDHTKGKAYDDSRAAQSAYVLSLLEDKNMSNAPVVIAGDLNSHRDNANQSKYPGGYDAPRTAFSGAGLLNTIEQAAHVTNARYNTVNRSGQANPGTPWVGSGTGYHIDAIWASKDFDVTDWTQLATWNSDGTYRAPYASDHNPVLATLVLR